MSTNVQLDRIIIATIRKDMVLVLETLSLHVPNMRLQPPKPSIAEQQLLHTPEFRPPIFCTPCPILQPLSSALLYVYYSVQHHRSSLANIFLSQGSKANNARPASQFRIGKEREARNSSPIQAAAAVVVAAFTYFSRTKCCC